MSVNEESVAKFGIGCGCFVLACIIAALLGLVVLIWRFALFG